ncbi:MULTISPECIES: AbrB/MazE/SpoVT family DNA-binding domain-containing protein [Xanthomonas]|uniref:AbrB/MazE/SpoVT family DNA-binding domain-containing protein n=1 Tax=Xanthomonas TaxID=338 RepID=UPI000BC04BD5|nr:MULTISPECIES: AbrB/MazE/SpoVT family DNA-binding domain-containing protein [Xanthomonas]ATB59204.1 SpoVT-AbrB domain superfamily protein [Xanthomonas citri pv. fuscans]QTJ31038.1 AbrB/MazE/SpoVT family DNA-binding domain-containing protein [Xanthomonas citri pv. phaseoli var. fuscans]QTJ31224.1 AbrB/MazE/SpoVT family DNA-binding domain-containing protein [Xanthomonas citri pv. phaseoli var. fuscans]QWN04135.1 AbrB/MazE/SpoVT family DNA-binding domain-containing protein [Xanthomonas citri pv.
MQIAKWGGSLAICLPVSVVEALELQEGDEIEIIVDGPRLFTVRKKPGLQTRACAEFCVTVVWVTAEEVAPRTGS